MTTLGFTLGPVQFDEPVWLMLIPIGWALTLWIGRSSLSGMGTMSRRLALVARLLVIAFLAGAIARPHWRDEAKNVTTTVVEDTSRSIPEEWRGIARQFVDDVSDAAERDDRVSFISVAEEAYLVMLPGRPGDEPDMQFYGDVNGTNLGEAIQLSLAAMEDDTANRILLVTEGNETEGSLLRGAQAAKAVGVPIDVLPVKYRYSREVIVDRLAVPATARLGENVTLRAVIESRQPTTGRLTLLVNGEPVDLDAESPEFGWPVTLGAGTNVIPIPVTLSRSGPQQFEAVFEPDDPSSDSIPENNRAIGVTFVSSEGRIMVVAEDPREASYLMGAMREARMDAVLVSPSDVPSNIIELGAYDCIVLVGVRAYQFSQRQQEDLRAYVHDLGGGLVMIGGDNSFGAGGWIGSPLADALPLKLDPPQKRQMPRGALVLIMHSCEMPRGNYWGVQTALAAVSNLSRLDLVGVVEYTWQQNNDMWVYPLSPVGNGAAVKRAINSLSFGDAPSFATMMRQALKGSANSQGLQDVNAGAKHVIIISDGDPQPPTTALINEYKKAKVSVSTVAVFPHMGGASSPDIGKMKRIATATGGRHYAVTKQNQLKELPNIFIREAVTVRRNMVWEGDPFSPAIVDMSVPTMRGIRSVPPITGYVVTGEREGLAQVVLRGQEKDPVLAMWQYGLGKSVAFTSDATNRWASSWVAWDGFRAFWEQHIRWAMRPGGSADVRIFTDDEGPRTRLIVEALDPDGERMSFVRWTGRVVGPDGQSDDVELRQVGPGRYEGFVESAQAGAYVLNLRYNGPPVDGGDPLRGTVQAAITRPFADEFRSLQDNAPLLVQVAEMTGGRVLDPMDTEVNLWDREGLTMPVATVPIWLQVALVGIGLFLADVAVRRVRIDPLAMVAVVRKGLMSTTQTAGEQMGTLKEARKRAQDDIAARTTADSDRGSTSGVKFEASDSELADASKNEGMAGDVSDGPVIRSRPTPTEGADEEEGMSRLMRAKKRAREEMGEDD